MTPRRPRPPVVRIDRDQVRPGARRLRRRPIAPVFGVLVLLGVLPAAAALAAPATAASPAPSPGEHIEAITGHDELTDDHAKLFRLYWAFFGREPDPSGAIYWIGELDNCVALETIADVFASSDEFVGRNGQLTDRAFVELIYRHVLDRAGDRGGLAYWTDLLRRDELKKGEVVLYVSLSVEFTVRHPYPSDGVPRRPCRSGADGLTPLSVHTAGIEPFATAAGITLMAPAALIELAGFHQSVDARALPMTAVPESTVRLSTLGSRNRGTDRRGAIDIVTEPTTAITSPVSGTVIRAGSYALYCRHRDGFVVIAPDGNPDLEVKILHVQDVAVRPGDHVSAGDRLAAHATTFPFRSQIDDLTAEPSWPHVHIEVVDPSIPRSRPSTSC